MMNTPDFQSLFEVLPSPHVVLDRDFNIVAANRAYEAVTMRPLAAMLGGNMFELFPDPGESGRKLRASFERVRDSGESDTLAYLRYDIARPDEQGGGFEQRYWTASHTPVRDRAGEVRFIMQNTVDVTDLVRLREAASLPYRLQTAETKLLERTREVERAHHTLMAESADFRRIFQQAPGFIAVLSGPEHTFTFANDAYTRLVGGRAVVGKDVRSALPEIDGQGFYEVLDKVFTSGEPAAGEGVRLLLQSDHGEAMREVFIDFAYTAIRNEKAATTGVFVQGMDRTESVRSQMRQRLLLDELNHRVKNTLATVQSIASQTLRSARDLPSARRDFEGRIVALSNAHNLLSARQWAETDIASLIALEASAHGGERLVASGPRVSLSPKASIAIAMLLHEMSTNAAKYGALSTPEGRVRINWRLVAKDEGDWLELDWRESGGPAVAVPERQGFGSRMIERVVRGELAGALSLDYAPDGLSCHVSMPASAITKAPNEFA